MIQQNRVSVIIRCQYAVHSLLESFEEATDYNSTLIEQLGIGREKPSSMEDHQESSLDENLDVHVDSQLATLMCSTEWKPAPQFLLETSNCINLHVSQGMWSSSSLQKALIEKFNCQSQEAPLLMPQVIEILFCERTMYNSTCALWTNLKQLLYKSLDKMYSYCSMKCSAVKFACGYFCHMQCTNWTDNIILIPVPHQSPRLVSSVIL